MGEKESTEWQYVMETLNSYQQPCNKTYEFRINITRSIILRSQLQLACVAGVNREGERKRERGKKWGSGGLSSIFLPRSRRLRLLRRLTAAVTYSIINNSSGTGCGSFLVWYGKFGGLKLIIDRLLFQYSISQSKKEWGWHDVVYRRKLHWKSWAGRLFYLELRDKKPETQWQKAKNYPPRMKKKKVKQNTRWVSAYIVSLLILLLCG